MTQKLFVLFGYDDYYPLGGSEDIIGRPSTTAVGAIRTAKHDGVEPDDYDRFELVLLSPTRIRIMARDDFVRDKMEELE